MNICIAIYIHEIFAVYATRFFEAIKKEFFY